MYFRCQMNIFFFIALARILRVKELRSALILVYSLTALVVSIYGIRQWIFGADALATWVDPESNMAGVTRAYSYLKNPNLLAGYLTLCLVGCLGLVAMGFVMMVLLACWLGPQLPPVWQRWSLPLLLGGSLAFVVAAVLFVPPVRDRVMSIFAMRGDSSNNFRLNVYEAVFDMIQARPIVGIGPGNDAFNLIYPLYQRPNYTALSAYSIYFETLVEGGVIAFAAFLWMLVLSFQQGWVQLVRLRQTLDAGGLWLIAALGAIAGLLVQGAFDTVWYRPQISTLWWMLLAIVASFYVDARQKTTLKALPSGDVVEEA